MASNDEYQQRQFFNNSVGFVDSSFYLSMKQLRYGESLIQKMLFYNTLYDEIIAKRDALLLTKNPEDLSLIQDIPEDDTLYNKE